MAQTGHGRASPTSPRRVNAISGTRLELYRRREVAHFLDPALFDAGVTSRTLDALLGAVRSRQEVPRRFLRRKAALLDLPRLGFQDLTAPLPLESQRRLSYDDACGRIASAFGSFYPALSEFATRAFERRWIDWESRPGKARERGFGKPP